MGRGRTPSHHQDGDCGLPTSTRHARTTGGKSPANATKMKRFPLNAPHFAIRHPSYDASCLSCLVAPHDSNTSSAVIGDGPLYYGNGYSVLSGACARMHNPPPCQWRSRKCIVVVATRGRHEAEEARAPYGLGIVAECAP